MINATHKYMHMCIYNVNFQKELKFDKDMDGAQQFIVIDKIQ